MNTDSRAPSSATLTRTGGTTRRTQMRVGDTNARRRHAKRRWKHRRRNALRVSRSAVQTVTPTGWFVLSVTLGALIPGIALGWIEAWFVVIVGVTVLLIAVPFLLGNRAYLMKIGVDRRRVVAGTPVHVSVDVENSSARPALPAMAELPVGDALRELPIPFIGSHGSAGLPVAVPTTARGVIDVGPITLARRDPLGLLRREVTWRDRHRVHVHPQTAPLPTGSAGLVRDLDGTASRRLTDSDLSFHAVREYVRGDAMRHVHWRSTAKTGTLMVRQYEESQTARAAVLFDVRREQYGSDDEFELGVSVAASLSLQSVQQGRERFVASAWAPGRVRPSIDGLEELPSQTPTQLLDAWAELESVEDAYPIERLMRSLAESRRPLSIVSVVIGSHTPISAVRRAAIFFPTDATVRILRCESLADPTVNMLDACTILTIGELGDLPKLLVRGSAA